MDSNLGLTRTVVRPHYALISRDGYVPSALPGWENCSAYVLVSSAMGAGLTQMLIDFAVGGSGRGDTEELEYFFYVVRGQVKLNGELLKTGGFGYVPPESRYTLNSAAAETQVLLFSKIYEPREGHSAPAPFTGNEAQVEETAFLGDPRARLKLLIPDIPAADMAVNVFTYDPGATLPFVETHIMEHGMLFLDGAGVYRLGDDWHPVKAGDALWIAPYCPQWFIAAGPGPARYIYYKDINRMPL